MGGEREITGAPLTVPTVGTAVAISGDDPTALSRSESFPRSREPLTTPTKEQALRRKRRAEWITYSWERSGVCPGIDGVSETP